MEHAQQGNGKAIKYAINAFVIIAICWMSLFNFLGMAIGGNFYLSMPELEEEILASIIYFSWIFGPVPLVQGARCASDDRDCHRGSYPCWLFGWLYYRLDRFRLYYASPLRCSPDL